MKTKRQERNWNNKEYILAKELLFVIYFNRICSVTKFCSETALSLQKFQKIIKIYEGFSQYMDTSAMANPNRLEGHIFEKSSFEGQHLDLF